MVHSCKYCGNSFSKTITINAITYTYIRRTTCYECNPSHLDNRYTKSEKEAIRRKSKTKYLGIIGKSYKYDRKSTKYRNKCKSDLCNMYGGKCSVCGCRRHQSVYDFHHENPNNKEFSLSGIHVINDMILNEIDKCIMVCANCHAEIHEMMIGDTQKSKNARYMQLARRNVKAKLVLHMGGCCSVCGYNKSHRALTFHHVNPESKIFNISSNLLRNWDELMSEINKCILICENCHREHHIKKLY